MNAPTKATEAKKPLDSGDEQQVAARTQLSKERTEKRMRGLGKILADPDCRAWLWELLAFCGVSRSSFTGNSTTFFNEGQRNVGLQIQADLTSKFPKQYVAMMEENS